MLNYLCFTAQVSGATIQMTIDGSPEHTLNLEYSYDGSTWYTFTPGSTAITLSYVGKKVYFRGDNDYIAGAYNSGYRFWIYDKVAVSGNVMSIIDSTCQSTTISYDYCFSSLFFGCDITSAPELPATTLAAYCYRSMFMSCENLTSAPVLPAMSVPDMAYAYMFQSCTSLTIPPALPATTVKHAAYAMMFISCSSLRTAPELPAMDVGNLAYCNMFDSCTSLTTVPQLPATDIGESSYHAMFSGCTSLKVYSSSGTGHTKAWRIPMSGTVHSYSDTQSNMFDGTVGDYSELGYATLNTTFYTQNDPIPIYYTLTFDINGHGSVPSTQTIKNGSCATQPTNPTANGYTFCGWYNESACTTAFSFSTPITANKTVYAKWSLNTYTLTYNLNGGSADNPSMYTVETSTFTLNNPTKAGCLFTGWTGTGLSSKKMSVTISSGSTGNRTYTANFAVIHNVDFNMQGYGSQIASQSIKDGNTASEPSPAPTATGYAFGGWYNDSACTNEFDFSTPIVANKTLYAKWEDDRKVIIDINSHKAYKPNNTNQILRLI